MSPEQRGIAPLINGVPATGAKIYFGSISELSGNFLVCKGLATAPIGLIGAKRELPLSLAGAPGDGARQNGFQNSVEDCGNWPYVYQVTMPKTGGQEKNIISFDEDLTGLSSLVHVHLFFFDNRQNAIGYANVANPELLPDAP